MSVGIFVKDCKLYLAPKPAPNHLVCRMMFYITQNAVLLSPTCVKTKCPMS